MDEVIKKPKHKSPSTILSRKNRTKRKNAEKKNQNRPPPNNRAAKKAELTELYGLPPDTKFLFFKKGDKSKAPFRIHFGTIVCLDKDTCDLLAVVRFVERTSENSALFEKYNHAIPTVYKHARARGLIKINGAAKKARVLRKKYGKMYAAGFRPGFDRLVKAASYAFNATTSAKLWRMQEDLTRQGNLPAIEDFFAERFAKLSTYAFESNAEIASRTGAPSWAAQSFYVSPNAQVFASNIAVTFDEFVNAPHNDNDLTRYSFGFFTRINRKTGQLYSLKNNKFQGNAVGSCFFLDDYNVMVDYDACDGVVEMLWNSHIEHHTSNSETYDAQNVRVVPSRGKVTRFGCACQINQTLVDRINQVNEMRGNMNDEEWSIFRGTLLTGYPEEARKKMAKLAEKNGINDLTLVFAP